MVAEVHHLRVIAVVVMVEVAVEVAVAGVVVLVVADLALPAIQIIEVVPDLMVLINLVALE